MTKNNILKQYFDDFRVFAFNNHYVFFALLFAPLVMRAVTEAPMFTHLASALMAIGGLGLAIPLIPVSFGPVDKKNEQARK